MNRDHEGDVKGFYASTKAWYAPYNDPQPTIMIGYYDPQGGTSGEFSVKWVNIGDRDVPQLQVFDDGWSALSRMPELVEKLGEQDSRNLSYDEIVSMLIEIGFTDLTPYKRPGQS